MKGGIECEDARIREHFAESQAVEIIDAPYGVSTSASYSLENLQLELGFTSLEVCEWIRDQSNSFRRPLCSRFSFEYRRWHARKSFGGDAPCGAWLARSAVDGCSAPFALIASCRSSTPLPRQRCRAPVIARCLGRRGGEYARPRINEPVFPSCSGVNSYSFRRAQSSRGVHFICAPQFASDTRWPPGNANGSSEVIT